MNQSTESSDFCVLWFRTGVGALPRSLLPARAPRQFPWPAESWLIQFTATPFSGELPLAKREPPWHGSSMHRHPDTWPPQPGTSKRLSRGYKGPAPLTLRGDDPCGNTRAPEICMGSRWSQPPAKAKFLSGPLLPSPTSHPILFLSFSFSLKTLNKSLEHLQLCL